MVSEPKWQSVEIKYPKQLYLWSLWFRNKPDGKPYPFFIDKLEKSKKHLIDLAVRVVASINSVEDGSRTALAAVLIVPLMRKKTYRLKKEMWSGDSIKIDKFYKDVDLLNQLERYDFYDLVVTPVVAGKDKKTIDKAGLYKAFTILKNADDAEIETLTKGSNMYVSPEAKNAGIYAIGKMYGYDLIKGEVVDREINMPKNEN
jgi:hypothetical protein